MYRELEAPGNKIASMNICIGAENAYSAALNILKVGAKYGSRVVTLAGLATGGGMVVAGAASELMLNPPPSLSHPDYLIKGALVALASGYGTLLAFQESDPISFRPMKPFVKSSNDKPKPSNFISLGIV